MSDWAPRAPTVHSHRRARPPRATRRRSARAHTPCLGLCPGSRGRGRGPYVMCVCYVHYICMCVFARMRVCVDMYVGCVHCICMRVLARMRVWIYVHAPVPVPVAVVARATFHVTLCQETAAISLPVPASVVVRPSTIRRRARTSTARGGLPAVGSAAPVVAGPAVRARVCERVLRARERARVCACARVRACMRAWAARCECCCALQRQRASQARPSARAPGHTCSGRRRACCCGGRRCARSTTC